MYDREKIEEALEARSLGVSSSQAAELAGVAPSTVEHWSKGWRRSAGTPGAPESR